MDFLSIRDTGKLPAIPTLKPYPVDKNKVLDLFQNQQFEEMFPPFIKDYHQADSILDIGLAKDSLNLSMLRSRLHSAYLSQDYAAALVPDERIIRLNQPILNALTWLSLSYYNLKKYNECITTCEYMLDNGFNMEPIYYYEARACAKLKEYDKSNQLLTICLKIAISHPAEWYYNDLAENNEALKSYKNYVRAHWGTKPKR